MMLSFFFPVCVIVLIVCFYSTTSSFPVPFFSSLSLFIIYLLFVCSYHGRPSMTAEYGVKVVHDLSMHYLFLCFILFMTGTPNALALFPLVSPDVYLVAGELMKTSPAIASSLAKPMKWIARKMYGTDDYNRVGSGILQFNCMAEIGLGITSMFEMLTPKRNVIGCVILWQFLRTRYMLMDDMKRSFTQLNQTITGYIGKIPIIGGVWKLIQKGGAWMTKMPEPGAKPGGLASKCTVM